MSFSFLNIWQRTFNTKRKHGCVIVFLKTQCTIAERACSWKLNFKDGTKNRRMSCDASIRSHLPHWPYCNPELLIFHTFSLPLGLHMWRQEQHLHHFGEALLRTGWLTDRQHDRDWGQSKWERGGNMEVRFIRTRSRMTHHFLSERWSYSTHINCVNRWRRWDCIRETGSNAAVAILNKLQFWHKSTGKSFPFNKCQIKVPIIFSESPRCHILLAFCMKQNIFVKHIPHCD